MNDSPALRLQFQLVVATKSANCDPVPNVGFDRVREAAVRMTEGESRLFWFGVSMYVTNREEFRLWNE